MLQILAIHGRGVQQLYENGPWALTEDLELCDKDGAHLSVRKPADDDNPLCMVGGGELNLLAGVEVYKREGANIVVCAYGDRSNYLKSIDAPSESMVMSDHFIEATHRSVSSKIWTKEMSLPGPSNTNRELQNIFEFAVANSYTEIGIVTVDVHMPRTMVMAQRHLAKPEFRHLNARFFVSEQVLVEANPTLYGPRREALRHSKSFTRNWEREQLGILKTITNAYDDEKPLVATPSATFG